MIADIVQLAEAGMLFACSKSLREGWLLLDGVEINTVVHQGENQCSVQGCTQAEVKMASHKKRCIKIYATFVKKISKNGTSELKSYMYNFFPEIFDICFIKGSLWKL